MEGIAVPGMVDAISAARLRLDRADRLFAERLQLSADDNGRLQPADEDATREAIQAAIRCLEEAVDALVKALAEEPPDASART